MQDKRVFIQVLLSPSRQITIPVVTVTYIKKTKTAILVPNALLITTTNERVSPDSICDVCHMILAPANHTLKLVLLMQKYVFQHVFVSFLSRDTTFKLLTSLCIHLDVSTLLLLSFATH